LIIVIRDDAEQTRRTAVLEIASTTETTEDTEKKNGALPGFAKTDGVPTFPGNWPPALFSVGSVTSVVL
jgi:hypothetical protein